MNERPRALLFDDDIETVDITKDTLEEYFDVTWVKTKEELDDKIERDHYSVIVTDVSIEDSPQGGHEIVDELRIKYRVTRTPVVVYSAVRNVGEIRKSQNRLFHSYVEKVGKNWQDKLLNTCIKATSSNRNIVSWNVFEACFEKIGKLDSEINTSDIPDAYILGINLGDNPTIRTLIAQIKNPDLDDTSWDSLEKALWKMYCSYQDQYEKLKAK